MNEENRIPTNLRTLMILEIMGRSESAMTPTQINAELGLPKQTVHRLCTTLENEGYLVREADGKRLRPSRKLRLIANGLLHASRFHITRHQILVDVANKVQETVNMVVPEETGMNYIDRVETDWPFRIQLPVGSNVPFHCTASGKTFMASMPKSKREQFVAGLKLKKWTDKTHQTAASLLEDLKQTRKRGYAIDDEEFMDDMVAIAVPVTDAKGRFVASLAFHGPIQRISIDEMISRKQHLFDGAVALSTALFDD
ncbi:MULTISPECIES: IclR family transcriptional regulator [unclassified Lentilitoribacter]|uniref:IclR family transcriptional regulator n=1 Tax=unclassified Lentilitoribacter TaxID=2647570 RepID=UPI00157588F2|nr:IclR family transcriptional regulator [Lentilitoribacter sp. Alg239-R112]